MRALLSPSLLSHCFTPLITHSPFFFSSFSFTSPRFSASASLRSFSSSAACVCRPCVPLAMPLSLASSVLGFPRIGSNRQLKFALESYWKDFSASSLSSLQSTAASLRREHWLVQQTAGASSIASNDFSLYDAMLDTALLFGAVPPAYKQLQDAGGVNGVRVMVGLARGYQGAVQGAGGETVTVDLPALEMKKWFDTNYHQIVPALTADQQFSLHADPAPVAYYREAKALGVDTRPVLIGPVTWLLLSNIDHQSGLAADQSTLTALVDRLVPHYVTVIQTLLSAGASSIQIDEPALVLDLPAFAEQIYRRAYQAIQQQAPNAKLILTTYFDDTRDHLNFIVQLPIHGLHLDLTRAPQQLARFIHLVNSKAVSPTLQLVSLGVIDGRNIWKANYQRIIDSLQPALALPLHVVVATSCSLQHAPHSLQAEKKLPADIKQWLAFAVEKVLEVVLVTRVLNKEKDSAIEAELAANANAAASRASSPLIHSSEVQSALKAVTPSMLKRDSPFAARYAAQQAHLKLPLFPTSTIGSFPQTTEVRSYRARNKAGKLSDADYDRLIREETARCIKIQEEIGLDVLVDGEFDRNDMVEFFCQQLQGCAFTLNGWVVSYGSRCVKPAIIYGDVSRPKPMTVTISSYAQSLSSRPVKGMLTGPITMLQWSFIRDDQPRQLTTQQLALAIRNEVRDLEAAGLSVIQVDEPAIREGLPLHRDQWPSYLQWSVDAFLLSTCVVRDSTQLTTHMCYSDFQDILPAIARMDADVLTIENARSDLKLLQAFQAFKYTNAIAPGLYDIHSARVPSVTEMSQRLTKLREYLTDDLLWIVPDCGLKTRAWDEVHKALTNLVAVAKQARQQSADLGDYALIY